MCSPFSFTPHSMASWLKKAGDFLDQVDSAASSKFTPVREKLGADKNSEDEDDISDYEGEQFDTIPNVNATSSSEEKEDWDVMESTDVVVNDIQESVPSDVEAEESVEVTETPFEPNPAVEIVEAEELLPTIKHSTNSKTEQPPSLHFHEAQIKDLRRELSESFQAHQKAKRKVIALQKQLDESASLYSKEKSVLEEQIEHLEQLVQTSNDEWKQRLGAVQDGRSELESLTAQFKQQISKKEAELFALSGENNSLTNALRIAKEERIAYEQRAGQLLQEKEQRIEALEVSLRSSGASGAESRLLAAADEQQGKELENITTGIIGDGASRWQQEASNLAEQLREAEREHQTLIEALQRERQERKAKEKEQGALKAQLARVSAECSSLQDKLQVALASCEESKKQLIEMERIKPPAPIFNKAEDRTSLTQSHEEERIDILSAQLVTLQSRIQETRAENAALRAMLERSENEKRLAIAEATSSNNRNSGGGRGSTAELSSKYHDGTAASPDLKLLLAMLRNHKLRYAVFATVAIMLLLLVIAVLRLFTGGSRLPANAAQINAA